MKHAAILCVFLCGVVYFFSLQNEQAVDLFLYLKNGEILCKERKLLKNDIFSFTETRKPWVNHTPVFSAIVYLVNNHFGLRALIFLKLFFITSALFLIFCRTGEITKNFYISLLLFLVSALLLKDAISIRPQIFTYFFFSMFVYLGYDKDSDKKSFFVLLPFLVLLWANTHAAFVIGILYLALRLVVLWLKHKNLYVIRYDFLLFFLCVLVSLFNPYGYKIYLYSFQVIGKPSAIRVIPEWQGLSLNSDFLPFLLFCLVFIFALGLNYKKIKLSNVLSAFPFLLLALSSRRNIPFFVLAAQPVVGEFLRLPTIQHISKKRKHSGNQKRVKDPEVFFKGSRIVLYVIFVFFVSVTLSFKADTKENIGMKYFPEDAIEFMRLNKISGNLFHHLSWGNYVIYKRYPEQKVFIDSRVDVYDDKIFKDYKSIKEADNHYKKLLDDYHIGIILIGTRDKLSLALNQDTSWERIYVDPLATVFVRKGSHHFSILSKYYNTQLKYPKTENGYFAQALNYYKAGDTHASLKSLQKVLEINPQNENARLNYKGLEKKI